MRREDTLQEDETARLAQLEADDFRFLMGHQAGRRFMRRMFGATEYLRACLDTNANVYIHNGKRAVGAALIEMAGRAGYTPEHFMQIMTSNRGSDFDQPFLEVKDGR